MNPTTLIGEGSSYSFVKKHLKFDVMMMGLQVLSETNLLVISATLNKYWN
jgi:hypothetical protein